MAYRFDGSTGYMEFAIAPFTGYTFGPVTLAYFLKRNTLSTQDILTDFQTSGGSDLLLTSVQSSNTSVTLVRANSATAALALNNSATWYLLVLTAGASGVAWRGHLHDGIGWSHVAGATSTSLSAATLSTDRFYLGYPTTGTILPPIDLVCAGIKKSDSTDLVVETLSRTAFSAWQSFGFDWLVGFDASGTRTNVGSGTGGNEISRVDTSLVSDPAGWSFAPPVAPVANFTGTPTSGTASLSVAFTDTSTNTPTSWSWTFGDGGTSTSQNPSHSYTTSGVYTVALTATNATGSNTKTSTGYITVGEAISYASGGGIFIY